MNRRPGARSDFADGRDRPGWIHGPGGIRALDQELYSDFEELRRKRAFTDDELSAWVSALNYERLAARVVCMRHGQELQRSFV